MTQTSKIFVIEKMISSIIVLGFIFMMEPRPFFEVVIVLGYSHFALTYFSQYKAGKIKAFYIPLYFIVLGACFYLGFNFSAPFLITTVSLFLLHNFFDELKLVSERVYPLYFTMVVLLSSIFVLWLTDFYVNVNIARDAITVIFIITVFIGLVQILWLKQKIPYKNVNFLFVVILTVVLLSLEYLNFRPNALYAFGYIITLHYFVWYVRMGIQFFYKDKVLYRSYIKQVVILNIFFVLGYFLIISIAGRDGWLYDVTYHPKAFYVWTFMHLVTTFRISDYKNAFNFSKVSA